MGFFLILGKGFSTDYIQEVEGNFASLLDQSPQIIRSLTLQHSQMPSYHFLKLTTHALLH